MEYVNPLLAAWADGRTTLGTFITLPGQVGSEALSGPGIDWACVDLQHGNVSNDDLLILVPAIANRGASPMARVAVNDATVIGQALDAGAVGVIVPLVDTAADAARAVAACRFPPAGVRSYGPARFGIETGAWEPSEVEKVACVVMIETSDGLANVEAIARTPGVDALIVGPSDLAIALGRSPWVAHRDETVYAAITRVREAAAEAGIVAGIVTGSGTIARRYLDDGFRMVCIATDVSLLLDGIARELEAAGVTSAG